MQVIRRPLWMLSTNEAHVAQIIGEMPRMSPHAVCAPDHRRCHHSHAAISCFTLVVRRVRL
jgi:hypothetical protein